MLDDTKVLFREAQSKDIVYVKAAFDVSHVSEEQLAILSMLTKFLVQLSTEKIIMVYYRTKSTKTQAVSILNFLYMIIKIRLNTIHLC